MEELILKAQVILQLFCTPNAVRRTGHRVLVLVVKRMEVGRCVVL